MSNIPHFPCWVRREFTHNHLKYHGEFLHALAIAVNTIPDRSLSFQVVFTGNEIDRDDWEEGNIHGGAMWARMPIQGLVADIPMDEWAEPMENHLVQPWDCEARTHSVVNSIPATDAAFSNATRVTFLGSIIPSLSIST